MCSWWEVECQINVICNPEKTNWQCQEVGCEAIDRRKEAKAGLTL